ncbi:MAG: anti-sigma factor family protein [Candidatus Brocadiia bacterium]
MKCKNVAEKLSAYLDGELSPTLKREIDNHLRSCPDCLDEIVRMRKVEQSLGEWPSMEIPTNFALDVRTAAEKKLEKPDPKKIIPLFATRVPALARAAAIIAVVIGVGLGSYMSLSSTHREFARLEQDKLTSDAASEQLLSAVPPDSITEAYLELMAVEE